MTSPAKLDGKFALGSKPSFAHSDERIAVSGKIVVYCKINETILGPCSGGIWTLVMKIDGSKVHTV